MPVGIRPQPPGEVRVRHYEADGIGDLGRGAAALILGDGMREGITACALKNEMIVLT